MLKLYLEFPFSVNGMLKTKKKKKTCILSQTLKMKEKTYFHNDKNAADLHLNIKIYSTFK